MFSRKRTVDREMGILTHPPYHRGDSEDYRVDFSNAALYLGGLQTVFTVCVCAIVSVLSCWLVPAGGVSAVRTLALCSFFGAALMYKPLRIGRAHGVTVVFESLQIGVPLYLTTQVIEQLIHTCAINSDASAPSWRRVIFHIAQLVLMASGFLRARRPMADTDLDFIITVVTLLVIALLPPPSIAFVGPLCQSVGIWEAADRVVRAFAFAVVYSVNVYSLTSSHGIYVSETQVVVTRSASASIWVLGSHMVWLPFAVAQCVVIIYARVNVDHGDKEKNGCLSATRKPAEYTAVETAGSADEDEGGEINAALSKTPPPPPPPPVLSDPVAEQTRMLAEPQLYTPVDADLLTGPLVAPVPVAAPVPPPPVPPPAPPPPAAVVPTRPQTPSEDTPPRGPRSFQLVSGPASADVPPLSAAGATSEADWQDRAAEIAERMRATESAGEGMV
jgi:hypothetical protein